MNNTDQKSVIFKILSIVIIIIMLFAGGPVWSVNAQDSPSGTPSETPDDTSTPTEIPPTETTEPPTENPTEIPTQKLPNGIPVYTETPTPAAENVQQAPHFTFLKPEMDIEVIKGETILIEWMDEYLNGDALISIGLDTDSDPGNGIGEQWLFSGINLIPDGLDDQFILDSSDIAPGYYFLVGRIAAGQETFYFQSLFQLTVLESTPVDINDETKPSNTDDLSVSAHGAVLTYIATVPVYLSSSPSDPDDQCVDLIKRFYSVFFGVTITTAGCGFHQSCAQGASRIVPPGFTFISRDSADPVFGDIVVFKWDDGFYHAALVRKRNYSSNYIEIVEQNWWSTPMDGVDIIYLNTTNARYQKIEGFLRYTGNKPVTLSSPANGASISTMSLDWSNYGICTTCGTSYGMHIASSTTFHAMEFNAETENINIATSNYTVTYPLKRGITYYWRVYDKWTRLYSNTRTFYLVPRTSTTVVTSDTPDPSFINSGYIVSVKVSGSFGTPTGTVKVIDGSGATCTATLSAGSGSCKLTSTTIGTKTLKATYSGDNTYGSSTDTETHTVKEVYGTILTTVGGIQVYMNNLDHTGAYQCEELVTRFYSQFFGKQISATGDGFTDASGNVIVPQDFIFYERNSNFYPDFGDIVVFNDHHAALVRYHYYKVNTLDIAEQNYFTSIADATGQANIIMDLTDPRYQKILGYLHFTGNHPPSLISPANGSSISNIVLDWGDYGICTTCGTSYGLLIATSTNFSADQKLKIENITKSNYTVTSPLERGITYYWKIFDMWSRQYSNTFTFFLLLPPSTTQITSDSPDPSLVNQSYTVNVSVSGASGTATGTVNINDGSGANCTATLSGGAGSCVLTSSSAGSKTLTATYSGNSVYNSSSDTETHTVNKRSSTTVITSDTPDPSWENESYIVNVSVSGQSSIPTGNVVISDGSGSSCTATLTAGTGSCELPFSSSGNKTISATYSGDNIYKSSTDTESHSIQSLYAPGLISKISLTSPSDNSLVTEVSIKLDWADVILSNGTTFGHYQVQVATDIGFANLVTDRSINNITSSDTLLSGTLVGNTQYFWRVRAFNSLGQYGDWSATRSFRMAIQQPVLSSPSNGSSQVNLRPQFNWGDVDGATSYQIQVSKYANMSSPFVSKTVYESFYDHTSDLPKNKTVYWRVRAKDPNSTSAWSLVWSFNTPNPPGRPSLLSPSDNALTRDYTPRLDWSTSSLPSGTVFSYYRLQVARDSGFTNIALDTNISGQSNSEYTFTANLAANTKYYWRVMAVNNQGQYRSWSSVRSFRTAILPPLLINPGFASVESTQRPLFEWEEVDGAASYQIQISRRSDLKYPIINVTVPTSEYLMMKNLPMNKDIYWRVRAKGANGPSAWSPTSSFIININ